MERRRKEVRREKGKEARLDVSTRGGWRQENESFVGKGWEGCEGQEGALEKDSYSWSQVQCGGRALQAETSMCNRQRQLACMGTEYPEKGQVVGFCSTRTSSKSWRSWEEESLAKQVESGALLLAALNLDCTLKAMGNHWGVWNKGMTWSHVLPTILSHLWTAHAQQTTLAQHHLSQLASLSPADIFDTCHVYVTIGRKSFKVRQIWF